MHRRSRSLTETNVDLLERPSSLLKLSLTNSPVRLVTREGSSSQSTSCEASPREVNTLRTRARSPILSPRSLFRRRPSDDSEASSSEGSCSSREGKHLIDLQQGEVQKHRLLGKGGTGLVFSGMINGFSVAIKEYRDVEIIEVLDEIMSEIILMERIQHPKVIRCLGHRIEKEQNQIMLFMELCHGSLQDLIDNQQKEKLTRRRSISQNVSPIFGELPENISPEVKEKMEEKWQCQPFSSSQIINFLTQIAEGLCFLHRYGIIHRDLKPPNIFYLQIFGKKSPDLKIGDFGEALMKIKKKKRKEPNVGTLEFRAPEMFADFKETLVKYNEKVDIWSLGMILFELLTLEVPYQTECQGNRFEIEKAIRRGQKPLIPRRGSRIGGRILPILFQKCTEINPKERPSSREIIEKFLKPLPK